MNTFLLAAVVIGLVAFLILNRRRQAAAGSAPAKERAGFRARTRSRTRGGKIKGYPDAAPEPAAAMAETAASRTLSPVMEPPPVMEPVAVGPAQPAPVAPVAPGDWGFDEMISEPGWPMPGEMSGGFDASTVTPPPPPPVAEPDPAPVVAPEDVEPEAPTGEWTMSDVPYGEPEPWTADPEPEAEMGADTDAGEPVMEAWVPGVSEVEPVVLPEPEPIGAPAAEAVEAPVAGHFEEPLAIADPEPALVWADPAPVAEPEPVADPEPVAEGVAEEVAEDVADLPAWEPVPAPELVAEPVDEPVLAVWEPVAVGEPVVPVEESPWQPAAPPLEPDPPADLAAHLDELAEGLPLAVAAVTPLLASSDHAGLTSRMAVVLRALADDPRGLPALARALGVSRPVVSGVCARLEALDLVQRLRDPADRRRILVVPTEKGLRIAEETEPRLDRDAVAGALGHLSAAELGALVSAVRALRG